MSTGTASAPRGAGAARLTRRGALAGVGAAAALTAAGCADADGGGGGGVRTYVLVPGSSANAYYWHRVATALTLAGHRALPIDLPGHGLDAPVPLSYQAPQRLTAFSDAASPVTRVGLDQTAEHVAGVVRRAARHGEVVLVGHSLGGATITRAANLVHDAIDHLVYVSAVCATRMRSTFDYLGTPEARSSLLLRLPPTTSNDAQRSGVTRTNWRTADRRFLRAYDEAVFGGVGTDELLRMVAPTHDPDESTRLNADDARGEPATWGRVPRTYVRLEKDRTLPPALQDRWIREADATTPGNRFAVRRLTAPHGAPLTHASAVAGLLDDLRA